jgi:serine/threonine protein kinase
MDLLTSSSFVSGLVQKHHIIDDLSSSFDDLDNSTFKVLRSRANSNLLLLQKEFVVLKIQDKESYSREVFAFGKIKQHPNVVSFQGSAVINSTHFLCLEYLPYQNLRQYITRSGSLPEPEALMIFSKLVNSVAHIHKCLISHHDIKTTNVMCDPYSGSVKLIDFGYAIEILSDNQEWNFGTPLYASPEVLQWLPHNPCGADVWGLGIVFYEMCTGVNPWQSARTIDDLVAMVMTGSMQFPSSMSPQIVNLIQSMTQMNPKDRISVKNLKATLNRLVEPTQN